MTTTYKEAYEKSIEDIERVGLGRRPPRPTDGDDYYSGYLPEGISKASMSTILEEMEKMEAFAQYVQALRVDAKNQLDTAEETLKSLKASIRSSKEGSKDRKDDLTIIDDAYIIANAEYMRKSFSYEKIVAREEMARRDIKFLSRLITATTADADTARFSNRQPTTTKKRRQWK